MRTGSWAEAIQHDGYFVVRLHVFTVGEGGQNRHVQSGMKGTWASPAHRPLPGLLVLASERTRSIAPGAEAIVHVRPLEPSQWRHIDAGMRLGLCKNWPRELGEGIVVERVAVPDECIPPRFPLPPGGTPAVAMLRRRVPLIERIWGAVRRRR